MHVALLLTYIGLIFFLFGFFLTRRELAVKAKHYSNSLNEAISAIDGTPKSLEDVSYSRFEGRSRNRPTPAVNKRRVFFFIVDALRLDFMVQQDDVISSESPYNRMVNMHRLLRYNASQCTLFGFRAEPPTVTSQRLKSLTTGSLPTFIDIGANMNSSAIIDDNFIDQLLNRHRNSNRGGDGSGGGGSGGDGCSGGDGDVADGVPSRLVVLGDDTWGSLFPAQFTTKHLYDSFNTRDLDTVDNGIISHLFDYLNPMEHKTDTAGKEGKNSTEWDLMIAHFLGVDHIGHTHHAFHPLMYDRLALMDALLQKVVEALPPDAVLFLFGDHGMTDEGEHGGASRAETDSGLFVYSKEPIFQLFAPATADHVCPPGNRVDNAERIDNITAATSEKEHVPVDYDNYTMPYWNDRFGFQNTAVHTVRRHPRTLPQTDFTPTVSLLLGLPIPASSLGMLIPELFQSSCQPPAYQPSSYQQQQQQQNRVSDINNVVQQNKGDVEICLSADSCSSTSCSATCCSEANSESIYPAAGQDCGNGFSVAEDALMEMLFTNAMQVWRYLAAYWPSAEVTIATSMAEQLQGAVVRDLTAGRKRAGGCKGLCEFYCSLQSLSPAAVDGAGGAAGTAGGDASVRGFADTGTHRELLDLESSLLQAVLAHIQYLTQQQRGNSTCCSCNTSRGSSALNSGDSCSCGGGGEWSCCADSCAEQQPQHHGSELQVEVVERQQVYIKYTAYFRSVQDFTRRKWTQFKIPQMVLGICILNCALIWLIFHTNSADPCSGIFQLKDCFRASYVRSLCKKVVRVATIQPSTLLMLPLGAAFHSMAAFSNSFVEQEHWIVFSLVQASSVVVGAQILCCSQGAPTSQANPTGARCSGTTDSSIKARTLRLLLGLMVALRLLWQYGPYSTFPDKVLVPEYVWTMLHPSAKDALTVTGVVLSVALLHVTYRQMSSAFASSRNSRADILGTCYRATHGAASLCVLLYWSIKYDHAWAADALFPNSVRQAALYLYTAAASVLHGHSVDWLLVLPRAVLTLCAATCASVIVSLLYMRCFAHSHIDSTQFQYVQLVHLCGSVAVVVCLLMGPAGCLPLAACVLHSVLYVRSFCSMLPLTGVNLFDTNTYVLADQQSSPKSTYSTPRSTGESAQCPQQRWLIRTLLQLSLALYFPVMGRFLYFLTGHRMDFGTLQLTAGFVGTHQFHYAYAGTCLAINTFGAFVLYVLGLHIAVRYFVVLHQDATGRDEVISVAGGNSSGSSKDKNCDDAGCGGERAEAAVLEMQYQQELDAPRSITSSTSSAENAAPAVNSTDADPATTSSITTSITVSTAAPQQQQPRQQEQQPQMQLKMQLQWAGTTVRVAVVYQCAVMCASCCAAALLRRHLMVWAIFAPKMAFEACIWLAVALTHQILFFLLGPL